MQEGMRIYACGKKGLPNKFRATAFDETEGSILIERRHFERLPLASNMRQREEGAVKTVEERRKEKEGAN